MDEAQSYDVEESEVLLIKTEDFDRSEWDDLDALHNLYEDHEIKEEIVIGPEVMQPALLLSQSAPPQKTLKLDDQIEELQQVEATSKEVKQNDTPAAKIYVVITDTSIPPNTKGLNNDNTKLTTNKAFENTKNDKSTNYTDSNPYICDVCGERFELKIVLNEHLKLHSELKRVVCCDQCTYKAISRVCLENHMKEQHDNISIVDDSSKCTRCNYTSSSRSHLKAHLLTHTDEKRYSCAKCNYKCNQKSSLRQHLLTHTCEKPYSCTYCNYKCSWKNNLRQHLLTHTRFTRL